MNPFLVPGTSVGPPTNLVLSTDGGGRRSIKAVRPLPPNTRYIATIRGFSQTGVFPADFSLALSSAYERLHELTKDSLEF
jgi:hypothetical protein